MLIIHKNSNVCHMGSVSIYISPCSFSQVPSQHALCDWLCNHGPQTLGPQAAFKQTYAELWLTLPFVSCEATALEGQCLLLLRRHAGTKWQTAVLIRATHHFLNLKCIPDIIFCPFSNSYRTHGLRSFFNFTAAVTEGDGIKWETPLPITGEIKNWMGDFGVSSVCIQNLCVKSLTPFLWCSIECWSL